MRPESDDVPKFRNGICRSDCRGPVECGVGGGRSTVATVGGGHSGGGHFGGGGAQATALAVCITVVAITPVQNSPHIHFREGAFAAAILLPVMAGEKFGQIRNAPVRSGSIRSAMNSLSRSGGLHNGRLLSNPGARGQIAAAAALAGWHGGGHGANGWWQHGDGGYGWVGPLFWPFAYYDIYDYTIWGDYGFWDYGYPDIYAGIFAPYGYDDLAGYMAQRGRGRRHDSVPSLAQMCGDDSRDVAGLPIDQIQEAIQPNDAQRAALDELANASIQAAQTIRSTCPTQVASAAPGRLAAMQQRVEAMISAVALVRPPLEKSYGLLDDEQKTRLNALAENQRNASASKVSLCPKLCRCAARRVPVVGQRARGQAAPERHTTRRPRGGAGSHGHGRRYAEGDMPAGRRRNAAGAACRHSPKRLDTMLQALKLVRPALEDFYATLSDEQKAQFEAIGPKRTA